MSIIKKNINEIVWEVDEEDNLVNFLKKIFFSKNLFFNCIKNKTLYVNNKLVKTNMNIEKKDKIKYLIKDEDNNYKPNNIPLDIVFENEDILVINKKSNITMYSDIDDFSLANAVEYYYKSIKLKRKIRFINRLDMETSGIVIIAKNPYIHGVLTKKQDSKNLKKTYMALVKGKVKEKNKTIEIPLIKSEDLRMVESEFGKKSITNYSVIEENDIYSMLMVNIPTGRTHQIRAHLSIIGNPIIGDKLYGGSQDFDRVALHAWKYEISDLFGKNFEFIANFPNDFKKFIDINFKD